MIVFTDRNPKWLNWIAPEQFNDYDLFRIVVSSFFIRRVPNNHLCVERLKNTDGQHRGKSHIG